MAISRADAVTEIANLLKPACVARRVLLNEVDLAIRHHEERHERIRANVASLEADADWTGTREELRRASSDWAGVLRKTLLMFEKLPPVYQAAIESYLLERMDRYEHVPSFP